MHKGQDVSYRGIGSCRHERALVYLDRLTWRELKRDIDLREFGTDLTDFSLDRRFTSGELALRDQPVVDAPGGMYLLPGADSSSSWRQARINAVTSSLITGDSHSVVLSPHGTA